MSKMVKDEQARLLSFHKRISSSRQFRNEIKVDECTELHVTWQPRHREIP